MGAFMVEAESKDVPILKMAKIPTQNYVDNKQAQNKRERKLVVSPKLIQNGTAFVPTSLQVNTHKNARTDTRTNDVPSNLP